MNHDTNHHIVKAKDEIINVKVKNQENLDLGKICEVMLDKETGQAVYVVLDFDSFLGIGGKLFALPWNAIHYDISKECFVLNIDKEKLKNAPGFDKNHWPDMADKNWAASITQYYGSSGAKSYWE